MDFNWFFSTLAQSSAAIIGLFGAFLLSSLLSRINRREEQRAEYDHLVNEVSHLRHRLESRAFDWYNEQCREEVFENEDFRHQVINSDGKKENLLPALIRGWNFSPYDDPDEIWEALVTDQDTWTDPEPLYSMISPVITSGKHAMMSTESDKIRDTINEARLATYKAETLRTRMHAFNKSRHTYTVSLVALSILLTFGVIYPISWLPISIGTIPEMCGTLICNWRSMVSLLSEPHGRVLGAVSVGIYSFLAYLLRLNHELATANEELHLLQQFTDLKYFSPYIAQMLRQESVSQEGWPSA